MGGEVDAAGGELRDVPQLEQLGQKHRLQEAAENDPLPLIGLAQLYRRDIPDLPAGPGDCDLLQVFW